MCLSRVCDGIPVLITLYIFFLIPGSMDSAWTALDVVTQTMFQKAIDGILPLIVN